MKNNELFIDIEKLPDILEENNIYQLFIKYKNGDNESRNIIIEHNIKLVLYLVNSKYNSYLGDKSELVSIGNIGLIKAVDSFEINKKIKFSTYASKCICNEIGMFLRKNLKHNNISSIYEIIYDNNGYDSMTLTIQDLIADDIDIIKEYSDKETYFFIHKLINELSDRDKEIILLFFGFYGGKTHKQSDIAKKLNISQSSVSRVLSKLLTQFKNNFELNKLFDNDEKKYLKRKNKL